MASQDSSPRRIGSQEQFGRQARYYTQSVGHSSGESIQVVREWASAGRYQKAVDVGTGTGFTAFAIAHYADSVVASDLTLAMLLEARSLAAQQGIANNNELLAVSYYQDPFIAEGSCFDN